jgi:hypothetical protein
MVNDVHGSDLPIGGEFQSSDSHGFAHEKMPKTVVCNEMGYPEVVPVHYQSCARDEPRKRPEVALVGQQLGQKWKHAQEEDSSGQFGQQTQHDESTMRAKTQ